MLYKDIAPISPFFITNKHGNFFITNKHGNVGQSTIHIDVYTAKKKESYPSNALHPIYEEQYNSVSFIVLFQIKAWSQWAGQLVIPSYITVFFVLQISMVMTGN